MARLIKCPRCQSQIDVTAVGGGSTVRCADCGAMIRVPTGATGQHAKVPTAAVPVAPAAPKRETTKVRAGGRQTDLFRKMAGTRMPGGTRPPSRSAVEALPRAGYAPRRSGGNSGVLIGVGAGILGLIVVMIFALQSKSNSAKVEQERKAAHKKAVEEQNRRTREENARQDAEYEAALAAQKAAEKDAKKGKQSLTKGPGGGYQAPATFEKGAAGQAKVDPPAVDKDVLKEYEGMARSGKTADIVGNPGRYMPALLNSLLSDDEPLARASFQALHDLCTAKKITTESGKNPVRLDLVNSSYYRGGDFNHWAEWWEKPQNKIAMGVSDPKLLEEIRTKGPDPAGQNWDQIMGHLRMGGAFDLPDRPEGQAFAKVKSMGPAAYPMLAKYIENEDILLSKAAVRVLNVLTGREGQMPTEATKASVKAEWDAWIKENAGK